MSDPIESEAERNRRHAEKMAKRKAARNKMLATKTEERGLVIVNTGTGKGKRRRPSLGLAASDTACASASCNSSRAIWDRRAALAESFPDLVSCRAIGEGFTWDMQDRARDIAPARRLGCSQAMLADPSFRLILLDELNVVLSYDYLPFDDVLAALKAKRRDLHVVVTGRNAKPELIELADLVTEMTLVKHPFRSRRESASGDRVLMKQRTLALMLQGTGFLGRPVERLEDAIQLPRGEPLGRDRRLRYRRAAARRLGRGPRPDGHRCSGPRSPAGSTAPARSARRRRARAGAPGRSTGRSRRARRSGGRAPPRAARRSRRPKPPRGTAAPAWSRERSSSLSTRLVRRAASAVTAPASWARS